MSRALRLCTLLLVAFLVLAGCGGDDSSSKATTKKDTGGGIVIDVTFKDGKVTPQGASIKVKAGKPIKLHIVADKPGELHVHSSPEQHIDFKAGSTEKTLTIKQPGVVDVEIHSLDKLVVQLEVS
jgi:hypothetical protein